MKRISKPQKGEAGINMWLILNVGIIALIVSSCATPPPIRQTAAPRALAALSCGEGQRIVIAVSPVESPDVAGIFKRSWSSYLSDFGLVGKVISTAHSPIDDLTPEFKKAIGAVLGPVDLQQQLLAQAEQVIKPRTSCETVFLPTTWEKPAVFRPSDRVVVMSFYFIFTRGRPTIMGYLNATVMTGKNAAELAKRADELGKIMEEMKKLEPYVRVTDKQRPDLGKLKQYAALSQKLGDGLTPYIDGVGTVNYTSPGHSTDEWLANGGAVMTQELAAIMDRLIGDVAGILFN
ncbi:MAG: hypothetical protein WA081_04230 [Desulfosalsimonadaceae bacterium]